MNKEKCCECEECECECHKEAKPLIDTMMGKAVSRKFLTFIVATVLMCVAELDSETWGMIAMIYIGSQSAIDLALAWRHGPA